jgi:hypothetical protein
MTASGSKLVPVGILLMLMGFGSGFVARAIGPTNSFPVALLVDGLRLCFWAGLICLILGALRNRRAKSANQ